MDDLSMENLTSDQDKAIKKMMMWWNLVDDQQYYRLVGYAGTGKTTIVNLLIKQLGLDPVSQVAFCAYTGSAAMNLVKKGNKNATTIHQLIYDTIVTEVPVYKKKKDPVTKTMVDTEEILRYEKVFNTSKKVELNPLLKLIVVDEFSMATDKILNDLLSYGIKVLMIGDSGQLPSIGSENTYVKDYDSILEEIVRQGESSPIVDLSFKARNKIAIPYGNYKNQVEVLPDFCLDDEDEEKNLFLWADQILCGKNNTRKYVNNKVRKYKGFTSKFPQIGDKVVCTQNNWQLTAYSPKLGTYVSLVNGTVGYVTKVGPISNVSFEFIIDIKTDFDDECEFKDLKVSFYNFDENVKPPSNFNKHGKDMTNVFDYAYCMTVHKAQGNGYQKVLVLAENMSFGKNFDIDTERRWLYTAITRAEKQLIFLYDEKYYKKPMYEKSSEYFDALEEYYE